jgi:hypothetical protein
MRYAPDPSWTLVARVSARGWLDDGASLTLPDHIEHNIGMHSFTKEALFGCSNPAPSTCSFGHSPLDNGCLSCQWPGLFGPTPTVFPVQQPNDPSSGLAWAVRENAPLGCRPFRTPVCRQRMQSIEMPFETTTSSGSGGRGCWAARGKESRGNLDRRF